MNGASFRCGSEWTPRNTPYVRSEVLGRFMASCSQVEVEVAQRFEKERLSIIKPSHCYATGL
jgi:hypothetical protein